MPSTARVATFDVGSNTVLCLVAERGAGGAPLRVVDRATITGLGRGSFARGTLGDDAIARTLAAVRSHAEEARALGATTLVGVGTSALRDARDRDRFVERAREILDRFDVISGDEEARLTFEGAAAGLALERGERAVLDIGGGSTEIAIGADTTRARTSLQLGSVRLFERALPSDPPAPHELAALRGEIERTLDAHGVSDLPPIVALAGTATTVAAVARRIPWPEIERVHGIVLHRDEIADVARALAARTSAQRGRDPHVEPARADVVVAGAILLDAIVRRGRSAHVTISDGGLRWGLATRVLAQA